MMDEFEKMISGIIDSASSCLEEYDDMKTKDTGNHQEIKQELERWLERCSDYLELAKEEAGLK